MSIRTNHIPSGKTKSAFACAVIILSINIQGSLATENEVKDIDLLASKAITQKVEQNLRKFADQINSKISSYIQTQVNQLLGTQINLK